jgi:cytochrome c oxidase assembly protein subunit 15
MDRPSHSRWLCRFALLTTAATLVLVVIGGLVTSKGAGMAVPDWPTSYGYNMFWLPISWWKGGVFYEHTHRLFAVLVGILTSLLAAWIWGRETVGRERWAGWLVILALVAMLGHRGSGNAAGGTAGVPFHFKLLAVLVPLLLAFAVAQSVRTRGSLRWLGMTAFFAVIFQGILGGFRVALYKDQIGILHGALAQLFFTFLCLITILLGRAWNEADPNVIPEEGRLRRWYTAAALLILAQLILGATMRHQHAGLAIWDFPLAHGQLWPETGAEAILRYNQQRTELIALNPITAAQVHLQMLHRCLALLIVVAVAISVWLTLKRAARGNALRKIALVWLALIAVQAALGVLTVLRNKPADIATAHVLFGALSLATGAALVLLTWRAKILGFTPGAAVLSLPDTRATGAVI